MIKGLIKFLKGFLLSLVKFVRRPKGAIIVVAILIILSFFLMSQGNPLETYDIGEVVRQDLVSIVDVTGRVKPAERVNMALERGGRVDRINVSVGDEVKNGQTLLSVFNADLYADLADAQANLEIEKLELSQIGKTSVIDLEGARQDLINEIQDAFVDADDAIRNEADQLFIGSEPSKSFGAPVESGGNNIDFNISAGEKIELNQQRRDIGSLLNKWSNKLSNLREMDIKAIALDAQADLGVIRDFLGELSLVVNDYNSNFASSTILGGYRGSLSKARSNINIAISNLRSARQEYLLAEASSSAEKGNVLQGALIQEQRVNNAQARVNSVWAEITKTVIKAPFDGVVTRIDTEIGEIVSSSNSVVSMISNSQFEIETFVPEADIAEIVVGNEASVTLDAYNSSTIFGAYVSFIDPAETIIEGVATYKVLLQFNEESEKILSGMTANVDIITGTRTSVLAVPQRAVINRDGLKFVRMVVGGDTQEVEVKTGLRSFDGYTEILEGLNEGDQIVIFVRS